MNNAERELQRRNQEKERIERNNYEIPYVRDLILRSGFRQ